MTNVCQIEERGWKAKPKQEMLSSRTAFLVVSVLFQVAKCSLGKLWLCIIEVQGKLLAIFHQFELFDCVFATTHSHSSVSSSSLARGLQFTNISFSKMRLKVQNSAITNIDGQNTIKISEISLAVCSKCDYVAMFSAVCCRRSFRQAEFPEFEMLRDKFALPFSVPALPG